MMTNPDPVVESLKEEMASMRTMLTAQNTLIAALQGSERPYEPKMPPALSILHDSPGAADHFFYWKSAVAMALDPLKGEVMLWIKKSLLTYFGQLLPKSWFLSERLPNRRNTRVV